MNIQMQQRKVGTKRRIFTTEKSFFDRSYLSQISARNLPFETVCSLCGADVLHCSELSDNELADFVKLNKGCACKELHARYQKKLFAYIMHLVKNKEEAEDILQVVFMKAFGNMERFDTSRKFSSWIYRISHNEAINFLKRRNKRFTVSLEDISTSKEKLEMSVIDEPFEDKWMQQEVRNEIKKSLEKLPEKYRNILHLRYFKEKTYEDIGVILGKPVNTVGTLINRAKKKLLLVVQKRNNGAGCGSGVF